MAPDARGLYRLDDAHAHLLARFVAQGWHAPRPELPISKFDLSGHKQILSANEILDLAHSEGIALKVEDGRLLMRGEPSARLRAHLRSASAALRNELAVRDRSVWTEV